MKKSKLLLVAFWALFTIGCGTGTSTSESEHDSNLTATSQEMTAEQPSEMSVVSDEVNFDTSPEKNASSPTRDHRSEAETVQEDVRKMNGAVYQADVSTVLDYTHPKIIDMLGGRSQAESALKAAFSQIQVQDMKLESLTFPAAPDFLQTGGTRFVIVPTKTILSISGQQVESLNYQFGVQVQENGTAKWKFIDGSRINKENVRSLFTDFPSDYQFPETDQKLL